MFELAVKKVDITPPSPLTLGGYMDRTALSSGVLHPLYATVFVMSDTKQKTVIITLDVLGVDRSMCKSIRDMVSIHSDIPAHHIMINASHTHAGPEAARFGDMGSFFIKAQPTKEDLAYYHNLSNTIASTILEIESSLQQVKIYVSQTAIEGVASNRIDPMRPVDNKATILTFYDVQDRCIAMLTHYACHPTVIDAANTLFSNDFISYFNQSVEQSIQGCISAYMQGCAGEISTRYTRKGSGATEAARIGQLLAKQVLTAITASKTKLTPDIIINETDLVLDIRSFEPEKEYAEKIKQANKHVEDVRNIFDDPARVRSAYVQYQGALMIDLIRKTIDVDHIDATMQMIQLGEVTLISTPGETFTKIQKDIQALDLDRTIIVSGYTNGYVGYIPDEDTYDDPNVYENNMTVIAKNSHQKIVDAASMLLSKK